MPALAIGLSSVQRELDRQQQAYREAEGRQR